MSEAPQKSRKRLRVLPAVLGAGLAGLLVVFIAAGCSAGQDTQTDSALPAVNGVSGQVGPIAIRDAQFAVPPGGRYSAGSSAPLVLTIVNNGSSDDELVEVTSPVAEEPAEIRGDRTLPARRLLQIGTPGQEARSPSSSVVVTTQPPSSSVTGSPAGGPSSSTSARPTAEPVEIGKATIFLNGLVEALNPGRTYPVTFVFRNAGSITLELPISVPTTARPEPSGASHG